MPHVFGRREVFSYHTGEMKRIMKNAVDKVYTLLWLKECDPDKYRTFIEFGAHYASQWDEPTVHWTWFVPVNFPYSLFIRLRRITRPINQSERV
jgi:hypothetical protein